METYVFLVYIKRKFRIYVKNAFEFCKKSVTALICQTFKNETCEKCVVNIASLKAWL